LSRPGEGTFSCEEIFVSFSNYLMPEWVLKRTVVVF
jgi:hypothetical protein